MIIRAGVTCYNQPLEQVGLMVHFYRVAGISGTGTDLGTLAALIDTNLGPPILALLTTGSTYRGVRATVIDPLPPSAAAISTDGSGPGLVAGDTLPTQVSGIITLVTNLGGRAYRGRKYMPFPGEADNDPGAVPSAAYQAALTALAPKFTATLTSAGANNVTLLPILWHRKTRTYTDLQGAVAKPLWATQRRRGMFGRKNVLEF